MKRKKSESSTNNANSRKRIKFGVQLPTIQPTSTFSRGALIPPFLFPGRHKEPPSANSECLRELAYFEDINQWLESEDHTPLCALVVLTKTHFLKARAGLANPYAGKREFWNFLISIPQIFRNF
jgi:hypothetical protein